MASLAKVLAPFSLQTPASRLSVWAALTVAVYISHFEWLSDLSLFQRFGLDWAPSIGLTRAYWLLLHGQPAAAWAMNGLIFIVLAIGVPLLARDLWSLRSHVRLTG